MNIFKEYSSFFVKRAEGISLNDGHILPETKFIISLDNNF
ncbi:hypothetical protein B188_07970 [Candidatus Brocadiaceae bacterium B188]|nr:hypothetical protein B188_07970 [Candidatus Brocadiaceae bacterium B188]